MGRPPGPEHELGARRGLHRQEDAAHPGDEHAAVQALTDLDLAGGVGAALAAAGELDQAGAEPDGVIARHGAAVTAAQEVAKSGGGRRQTGVASAGGWAKRRL